MADVLYGAFRGILPPSRSLSHLPLLGGDDEPKTLLYAITSICPKGADSGHYTRLNSPLETPLFRQSSYKVRLIYTPSFQILMNSLEKNFARKFTRIIRSQPRSHLAVPEWMINGYAIHIQYSRKIAE